LARRTRLIYTYCSTDLVLFEYIRSPAWPRAEANQIARSVVQMLLVLFLFLLGQDKQQETHNLLILWVLNGGAEGD
jgi:hypothetical protein